jgi:isochorismate hydrolase
MPATTPATAPATAPASAPSPAPGTASPAASPAAPAPAAVPAAVEPSDEQLMAAVVADLQRYAQFTPDEVRRELASVTQALVRQRSDAHRVRLAVLYTLVRTPQDDQRALQLFDNVAKSGTGSPAIKQLAVVLQVQVAERARAVREEQQKADAAVQKLEALRAMERSLLRDRVRSGGGGGGGGGGSGN